MKRIGNLYQSIISLENLYKASHNAQKGKRNTPEVIKWNRDLDENILQLHSDLKDFTYKLSKYSTFIIKEPKERIISKLKFRDRVVHHAILLQTSDIFINHFISQTYSCIKGRGIHKCFRDLRLALKAQEGTKYCLKLDIKKFYPSINNKILKEKLIRKFKDPDLLWLFDMIISSHTGIPLGNYTSQWLGNYYLTEFDRWLKQGLKIKRYFRYCDDMVILHPDKEYLHGLRLQIQEYLGNLKLELSNYQVFPIESRGIDFLGYVFDHDHIRLRKTIKEKFRKKLRSGCNIQSKYSYLGLLGHANCRNLERTLLTHFTN